MDKSPLQSKKFIAYLEAEAGWKLLAFTTLVLHQDQMKMLVFLLLLAIVFISGFVQVMYIGRQADLDKFVRLAQIAADTGATIASPKLPGLDVKDPKDPDDDDIG